MQEGDTEGKSEKGEDLEETDMDEQSEDEGEETTKDEDTEEDEVKQVEGEAKPKLKQKKAGGREPEKGVICHSRQPQAEGLVSKLDG